MKAVILEIRDSFAAVLADDGSIVKLDNNNYTIGQVIELQQKEDHKTRKLAIWAASAAAALLICGTGAWAFYSPYSYVSLDVNPSIEYTLNRFDRVLSVKAVNDDGQEILKEIQLDDLNYQKIEDAVDTVIDQLSKDKYFDGDIEGGIVIATSSEDEGKAQELADEIKQEVEDTNTENGDEVAVEAISVGKERVNQARELGVTPGKLNLVEKLKASAADPDSINIEEWLKKPVKEIMKATKDNIKATKGDAKTDDENAGDNQNQDGTVTNGTDGTQTDSETDAENQDKSVTSGSNSNTDSSSKATSKSEKKTTVTKRKTVKQGSKVKSNTSDTESSEVKAEVSKKTNEESKKPAPDTSKSTTKSDNGDGSTKQPDKSDAAGKPDSKGNSGNTKSEDNSSKDKNDKSNNSKSESKPSSDDGGIES